MNGYDVPPEVWKELEDNFYKFVVHPQYTYLTQQLQHQIRKEIGYYKLLNVKPHYAVTHGKKQRIKE